jgi:hypothetical protein
MTDWKAMAQARGVPLSEEQAARADAVLSQLETDFARLKERLTGGDQPATVFRPEEGE